MNNRQHSIVFRFLFYLVQELKLRDLISQRTREGLASARVRGRNGGRPPKSKKDIDTATKMYNSRVHSVSEIEKATGVSKATLYRYIKKNV